MYKLRAVLTYIAVLSLVVAISGCGRKASDSDVVSIHFTASIADEGRVFETTANQDPRVVHIGSNLLLPALEQALIGMRVGERKTFTVPWEEGFGPRREDEGMIHVLPTTELPPSLNLQVGQRIPVTIAHSEEVQIQHEVLVAAIDESNVTLDANHPLAGKDLVFDVELVAIH